MKDKVFTKELSAGRPSRLFVFIHDFWDYHKSYLDLANSIHLSSNKEISSLLLDLPGFGFGGGTRGHLESIDETCLDIANLLSRRKEKKIIIGGHGLGGLISLKIYLKFNHILAKQVEGIILCNPFFDFNKSTSKGIIDSTYVLKGPFGKLKLPHISGESIFTKEMKMDPLNCKKISLRLFGNAVHDGEIAKRWGEKLDIPTLVMTSCGDHFYSIDKINEFSQYLSTDYKTIYQDPHSDHWLFQNGRSESIIGIIKNWIDTKI